MPPFISCIVPSHFPMPHTGTIKKYVDMLLPVFLAHVSHASLRRIDATRMLKTHLTFVIMLFIALCLGGGGEQPVHPSLISWFPTLRSMGVCQTGQWSGWVSST